MKVIRNPNYKEESDEDSFAFLASISVHGDDPNVMHRGMWGGNIKTNDSYSISIPAFHTEEDITKFVEVMLELNWDSSMWDKVLSECKRSDGVVFTLFENVSKERIKQFLIIRSNW